MAAAARAAAIRIPRPGGRHRAAQPSRTIPILLVAISLIAACLAGTAQAAGESYWGAAAADSSDSTRAVYHDSSMPLTHAVFYWPVRIVTFPLALLADGAGAGAEALDKGRVIHQVGEWVGPRKGPFGIVLGVQAGGLSGFGAGVSVEHDAFFRKGNLLRVRASTTVNGDHRGSVGLRIPTHAGGYSEYGIGYRARENARYFGIGPATEKEDESYYKQELFWAGTSLRRNIGGGVFAEGDLLYSSVGAGEPRDDASPSISTVFAGNLPPGFGEHSYGVSLGVQLSDENDLSAHRPTKGGSRRIRVERFESTDRSDIGFWSYRAELQQFFSLWYPYRILALRAYGSWLDPSGNDVIPFQRLMINDTPDAFRGYRSFRFRDRGMLALDAEYRFPIIMKQRPGGAGIDLYPLADWGQVFARGGEVTFQNMNFSCGLGLRYESVSGFVARVEWARSEEENTFNLRMDQIFQFTKLGFLYGRDPVPAR